MKIHTIETAEEFFQLRNGWNGLLQSSDANGIFLTHEWLSTWWKHMAEGRRLCILTAQDEDGKLAGILPLAERGPQAARMMPRMFELLGSGTIGSDYLDVIARKGRDCEVTALFGEHLARQRLWLQLNHLRHGACLASRLAADMAMRAWTMQEAKVNVCPYIDLRGHTWNTYLAAVSPGFRRNLNRCLQNLFNSFQVRVDCVRRPADAQAALEVVIDLHRRRWSARGTSEAFQSEPVVGFHREFVHHAAERGWLRLVIVRLNEAPVAALYGLRYGPTFYFYQSGFDPAYSKHSVGVVTMALTIRLAIEEKASEYDFLHGDEEYKFRWTRSARDLSRIELHPPCRKAWVFRHAIELNRAARRMARRVLSGQGIHR